MAIKVDFSELDHEDEVRATALFLATLHHGMANMAEGAVPCGASTVLQTATTFEDYINGVPINDSRRRR